MGLEYRGLRPYYYRKVRRGGRVTSLYVASGELASLLAEAVLIGRDTRRGARDDEIAQIAQGEGLERFADAYDRAVERVYRDALARAGYHQHARGRWRKARARPGPPGGQSAPDP